MDHDCFERKTQHFLATIIVQTFLFVIRPVWLVLQVGTKISKLSNPIHGKKNKRKLFSDGMSRGPPLARAALNREESLSLRVQGKFLRRQSYAICKMLRLNLLISVYYFISVSLCLLLLLLLLFFIDLSLPKRSIWFRSSQQWLWLKGLGQRSSS